MAATFYPARGCVYVIKSNAQQTKGFYSIEGLQATNSIILLQGVERGFTDILQPVVTLEDTKLIYSFGTDFGSINIYGEVLLGPAGGSGNGIEDVVNFFQAKRISKTKTPVPVSIPGSKAVPAYLYSLTVGRVDPEFHVQPFLLTGLVADNA